MPIGKTPSYPRRRDVLKGIVKTRQKDIARGNQRERLIDLYSAQVELLKENQAKLKGLIQKQMARKSSPQRLDKLKYAQEDTALKIKEMNQLLADLKK